MTVTCPSAVGEQRRLQPRQQGQRHRRAAGVSASDVRRLRERRDAAAVGGDAALRGYDVARDRLGRGYSHGRRNVAHAEGRGRARGRRLLLLRGLRAVGRHDVATTVRGGGRARRVQRRLRRPSGAGQRPRGTRVLRQRLRQRRLPQRLHGRRGAQGLGVAGHLRLA